MALVRQDRSPSPTRILWENRRAATKVVKDMAQHGLHVFHPEWTAYHSASFAECTLKVFGSDETMTLPVQTCTKVRDVKNVIAFQARVNPDDLIFVIKQGCSWVVQSDSAEIGRKVNVRGLKSFKPQKMEWPHPVAILGAGYGGIRTALTWAHEKSFNFHMFERYDRVGGHAWLVQANKTSKLQTELAAFHVWFGHYWGEGNDRLSFPTDWATWPKKDEILQHFEHAVDRYGLRPHIRFRVNVVSMETQGQPADFWRSYKLTLTTQDPEPEYFQTSAIFHFPGAYFIPRRIEYPGEDIFDGQFGYGMNDDIPYDYLEGNTAAILGNGAFAVENIRTCCEYGVEKVWLVTRRKNLPSPRLACWFVHQAIVPVPAAMVLNTMAPMYKQCGFGDPWSYHSVYGSKEKNHCTISSNSRFGIGDVTFLAVATGRCEYVVDTVKRCSRHTLHLHGGRKLEGVTVVVKALGLLADWTADKFHHIKSMIGFWPECDYRRIVYADPLGMHAANFTTFSTGIGGFSTSLRDKYFLDYPFEMEASLASGMKEMLPINKADEQRDRPAHQFDSKYLTSCSMVVDGHHPKSAMMMAGVDEYMSTCLWTVNPLGRYFAECKNSWDQYQADWWKMGFKHEYVPYPYTQDMVHEWFDEYRRTVGPTSVEEKKAFMDMQSDDADAAAAFDTGSALDWWKENCQGGWQVKNRSSGH